MPIATLKKYYPEPYFNKICKKKDIPQVFGYYAWLLNEGTGAGEDIINSLIEYRKELIGNKKN